MCICSLFGRLFHKTFSNTKLIDLLGARPVIGNLLLTSLVATTSILVVKNVAEDSISSGKLCDAISADVENRLNVKSDEIDRLSAKSILSDKNNKMVSCLYEFEKPSGSEKKRFDVVYRASDNGLTSNIEEVKITKEDLIGICEDESIYETKETVDFSPVDIELFPLTSADKVYPAFRWRCRYFPPTESVPPSAQPDEQADPRPVEIGINLDNFCQEAYGDRKLTKATFHYYDDMDSWYCTNPNITADFD